MTNDDGPISKLIVGSAFELIIIARSLVSKSAKGVSTKSGEHSMEYIVKTEKGKGASLITGMATPGKLF